MARTSWHSGLLARGFQRTLILAAVAALSYYLVSRPAGVRQLSRGAEAGSAAEDHFSPAENLEQLDRAQLSQAKHTVDIAMYAFTDEFLATELQQLAQRGVVIRIYRDQSQYQEEQNHAAKHNRASTTSMLTGETTVHIRVKGSRELMHLKAYLVDGMLLRDGSANWSPSGLKRQDNNAHFTTDPAQVNAFRKSFEEMWERPDNLTVQ